MGALPDGSKIERMPVSAEELLFHIPATGSWGGWLFFAVFWNAISWTMLVAFLFAARQSPEMVKALAFVAIFPVVGIGLAYAAIRTKYASHLLYLSPSIVRLQRQLFGRRKTYEVPTDAVVSVQKVEFYKHNYQPVFGVEIKTASKKIRFGSMLSEAEKDWLCAEIQAYLNPEASR